MNFLGKILLLNLPPSVEAALLQFLGTDKNLKVIQLRGKMLNGEDIDMIVAPQDSLPAKRAPGIPLLALNFSKGQRLGLILRRIYQILEEPSLYLDSFALGARTFSPQDKSLTGGGSEDINLTDREVDILVYLAKHANRPVSRDDLLKNVWRYQEGLDTHTLETHIYRLRQKIEKSAEHPLLLLTAKDGYSLNLESDEKAA